MCGSLIYYWENINSNFIFSKIFLIDFIVYYVDIIKFQLSTYNKFIIIAITEKQVSVISNKHNYEEIAGKYESFFTNKMLYSLFYLGTVVYITIKMYLYVTHSHSHGIAQGIIYCARY